MIYVLYMETSAHTIALTLSYHFYICSVGLRNISTLPDITNHFPLLDVTSHSERDRLVMLKYDISGYP